MILAKSAAHPAGAEIVEPLYRDTPFSFFPGAFLQVTLKTHSRKRVVRAIILFCDSDDDRAVGILSRPVMIAHSIDRQIPFLR